MRCNGFTLVELVVTVAIAAIVVTLALPSFAETMRQSTVRSLGNDLMASLNLARTEAVRRGGGVSVQAAGSGTDWTQGWVVVDGSGAVLARHDAVPQGYGVFSATVAGPSASRVSFDATGAQVGAGTFHLNVCRPDRPKPAQARHVVVGPSGESLVYRGTAGSPAAAC